MGPLQEFGVPELKFLDLFEKLGRLPEFVWRFGLVPLAADTWPLLQRLRNEPLIFKHPETCDDLRVFVDGSCYWPKSEAVFCGGICCRGSRHEV